MTINSMSPVRRRTLTVTSCSCRMTSRSALAAPTCRFVVFARLRKGNRVQNRSWPLSRGNPQNS
jgi:hypothetical protein